MFFEYAIKHPELERELSHFLYNVFLVWLEIQN